MATSVRPAFRLIDQHGQRVPPHNLEAEMCLLGAILSDNRALEVCEDFLEPAHFADYVHQRVFDAARTIVRRGGRADRASLHQVMTAAEFHAVGGPDYLARLIDSTISIAGVAEYAKIVLDMAARRALLDAAAQMVDAAHDGDLDRTGWTLAEDFAGALDRVAAMRPGERTTKDAGTALDRAVASAEDAYRRGGARVGKPTGLDALDGFMGGLFDSDLVVVGGRSGMGKSALAMSLALACARAGVGVAFFSLEMPAEQLGQRMIAHETGVSVTRQRKGLTREHEWPAIIAARDALKALPLFIEDETGQTIERIRQRARVLKYRRGAGLVIIDHLQRIAWSPNIRVEQEAITHAVKGAKSLATDLAVPVVLLSQLVRDVDRRDNPRPTMADLRGSGMIEAEADAVLLLYRAGYYSGRRASASGAGTTKLRRTKDALAAEQADAMAGDDDAEIIIGKNRHGPEGTVTLRWDGPRTRFEGLGAGEADDEELFR